MAEEFVHEPVMLEECMEALAIRPRGIYVDGTAGGGGHSWAIAQHLIEGGRLYAFDKDPDAVRTVRKRLMPYAGTEVFLEDYGQMSVRLAQEGVSAVDGILLDLGVSSFQLDTAERGFSYSQDAPLDMRMSKQGKTAADVLNTYDHGALCRVFREYGEEKFASQIAAAVIRQREKRPLQRSGELVELIRRSIPAKARREGGHPGKRVFQALRIEVNDELGGLEKILAEMPEKLRAGGRMCVITFHSLEDRMVKRSFRQWSEGCSCPPDFPVCVCGKQPRFAVVTKKAITASKAELARNSRSQSAKLRILERIGKE